ncbi:hypothetical protein DID75_01680 [Candidatus Marinamargulisbacteria bacterium SCGC AG-410-N11]|nr:hypothetical protein DID75_01680 [Candidatus Marinamargulisbacteria bacterium SCGC AG-410-N11]
MHKKIISLTYKVPVDVANDLDLEYQLLRRQISFLYRLIKPSILTLNSNEEFNGSLSKLLKLDRQVAVSQSVFYQLSEQLESELADIKQGFFDFFQSNGFDNLMQVLAFYVGFQLANVYQKVSEDKLLFFNQVMTPTSVSVIKQSAFLKKIGLKSKHKLIKNREVFIRSPHEFKSKLDLNSQINGVCLCVPLEKKKWLVVGGNLKSDGQALELYHDLRRDMDAIRRYILSLETSDDRVASSGQEDVMKSQAISILQSIFSMAQANSDEDAIFIVREPSEEESASDSDKTSASDDVDESDSDYNPMDIGSSDSESDSGIARRVKKRARFKDDDKENRLSKKRRKGKKKSTPIQIKNPTVSFRNSFLEQLTLRDYLLESTETLELALNDSFKLWIKFKSKKEDKQLQQFRSESIVDQFKLIDIALLVNDTDTAVRLYQDLDPLTQRDIFDTLSSTHQQELTAAKSYADYKVAKQSFRDPLDIIEERVMVMPKLSHDDKGWLIREIQMLRKMPEDDSGYQKKFERLQLIADLPFYHQSLFPVSLSSSMSYRQQFIDQLRTHLNSVAYGQQDIKERMVDVVSQLMTNPGAKGKAVLFIGPPGTGKTTFVRDGISKCLGYHFAEVPLAGISDSGYLAGHGYTYEGSQAGEIVNSLVKAKGKPVVFFLDEVDKIGKNSQGDAVAKQLIQLIDFSQNDSWKDKYIPRFDIDLSRCLFFLTANDASAIDPILLNRMEVIYTRPQSIPEKVRIALDYQIPRIEKSLGFLPSDISFSEQNIQYLLQKLPWDAGSRTQGRIIEKIYQKLNSLRVLSQDCNVLTDLSDNSTNLNWYSLSVPFRLPHFNVSRQLIDQVLQDISIDPVKIRDVDRVGEVNGLFATMSGAGGLLPIQFQVIETKQSGNKIVKTGSLGDVMSQSMDVALANASHLLGKDLSNIQINIHATETAVPKDGPSAGGAITVGILSSLTQSQIKRDVAMTGEIDLHGNITKIGGLRAKLQSAKLAGITCAYIPAENKDDFDRLCKEDPGLIDADFKVVMVNTINELIEGVFVDPDHVKSQFGVQKKGGKKKKVKLKRVA